LTQGRLVGSVLLVSRDSTVLSSRHAATTVTHCLTARPVFCLRCSTQAGRSRRTIENSCSGVLGSADLLAAERYHTVEQRLPTRDGHHVCGAAACACCDLHIGWRRLRVRPLIPIFQLAALSATSRARMCTVRSGCVRVRSSGRRAFCQSGSILSARPRFTRLRMLPVDLDLSNNNYYTG
jgi:hypothetical protein